MANFELPANSKSSDLAIKQSKKLGDDLQLE